MVAVRNGTGKAGKFLKVRRGGGVYMPLFVGSRNAPFIIVQFTGAEKVFISFQYLFHNGSRL